MKSTTVILLVNTAIAKLGYKVFSRRKTWSEAFNSCRRIKGAQLAAIPNTKALNLIKR